MSPEFFQRSKKEQFDKWYTGVLERTGIKDVRIIREKIDQRLRLNERTRMNPKYDEVDLAVDLVFKRNFPLRWLTRHPLLEDPCDDSREIQFLERLAAKYNVHFHDIRGQAIDLPDDERGERILSNLCDVLPEKLKQKALEAGLDEDRIDHFLNSVGHIHVMVGEGLVHDIVCHPGEHQWRIPLDENPLAEKN